ncbi:MAG: type III-B CRISPR module RAMP protein Cmr6 [Spirochaetales bacterium]|nr:type III-B CRISPR module RAMP protein Cmr6 [Spirochaetales bacterium]
MFKPYYRELQNLSEKMHNGNFGLWYNKFIPLNTYSYEPCGKREKKEDNLQYYKEEYNKFKNSDELQTFLNRKHIEYHKLIEYYKSLNASCYTFTASLVSPLIIGVGETHPSETSLIFNHNLGIPYIPASSIKGIIRFAYTLDLLKRPLPDKLKKDEDYNLYFDDEDNWTDIAIYFGTMKQRGSVLFLDAYPVKVPDLKLDIINPHYGQYYGENKAPADYLSPIPIKFLTVKEGSEFIFRAIITKGIASEYISKNTNISIEETLKNSLKRALVKEGIGAKTTLGYGRFKITEGEPSKIEIIIKQEEQKIEENRLEIQKQKEKDRIANLTPEELILEKIEKLGRTSATRNIAQDIGDLWSEIKKENYTGKEIFSRFKDKLIQLNEWEPKGNKRKKEKYLKRKQEIMEKLNA